MKNFSLQKVEEIEGEKPFYKLIIDENCLYDEFEAQIRKEGNWAKQLNTIQTRMLAVADGNLLSKEKFRDITPKKEAVKEYEIKAPNLRVYLIEHTHSGKIIIFAGRKTTQDKDITKFRNLKAEYLASLAEE